MESMRAPAKAVYSSVRASVLSYPAARMGNILMLPKNYELSFNLQRLRSLQQVL
jgi:hypothetical protein